MLNTNISARKWDELNARLGPSKQVNLIIVRLKMPQEARDLEAKWVGGKKNDLVLTYDGGRAILHEAHVYASPEYSRGCARCFTDVDVPLYSGKVPSSGLTCVHGLQSLLYLMPGYPGPGDSFYLFSVLRLLAICLSGFSDFKFAC